MLQAVGFTFATGYFFEGKRKFYQFSAPSLFALGLATGYRFPGD